MRGYTPRGASSSRYPGQSGREVCEAGMKGRLEWGEGVRWGRSSGGGGGGRHGKAGCTARKGSAWVLGVAGEERNRDLGGEGSLGGVDAGLGVLHRKRGVTSEPSGTSGDLTREALDLSPCEKTC